jgi:hypothetical protein
VPGKQPDLRKRVILSGQCPFGNSLEDFMKCHMNKTLVLSGAGILLTALFASCAFPFQQFALSPALTGIGFETGSNDSGEIGL